MAAPQPKTTTGATTLPGEATACAQLGHVACRDESMCGCADGSKSLVCFGADGKATHGVCPRTLACSAAQWAAWHAAYADCRQMVPTTSVPVALLHAVVDAKALPKEVCRNIDGNVFSFSAKCSLHRYTQAGDTNGGCGNFHGGRWSLEISPPTAATLTKATQRFADCKQFRSDVDRSEVSRNLEFSSSRTATMLTLSASYLCPACEWSPAQPKLAKDVQLAAKQFRGCGGATGE